MRDIGHFIGGKPVAGTSGRTGDVFNPNTGEVQAKVALASKADRAALLNRTFIVVSAFRHAIVLWLTFIYLRIIQFRVVVHALWRQIFRSSHPVLV